MMTEDETSSDNTTEAPSSGEPRASVLAGLRQQMGRAWPYRRPILLLAVVFASAGLAVGLFIGLYRPDREVDHHAADQAIRAASDGAVALLTYSSDSLDRDLAEAKTHLTGDFLDYYTKFTRDVVAPAVRDKHLIQKATVIRAATIEVHPQSAVVLVFLNETTTSPEKKDPLKTPTSVRVGLEKVDGTWLISKFDPVG